MANKRKDEDRGRAATAAARPAAQDAFSRESAMDSDSGDPFLDDMTKVANETVLDGNAQVNSPQATEEDEEGSAGTSR